MAFTGKQITELMDLIQSSGWIHAKDIAAHFGLSTKNQQVEARNLINAAIRDGHLIMSNTYHGYKVPDSKEEFLKYLDSLDSRIAEIEKRKELLIDNWNTTSDDGI